MTLAGVDLEASWRETARRAGLAEAQAEAVFQDLCRRYSEPQRAYHDLSHVAAMLNTVAPFAETVRDPAALHLAIWFHDAVYDARSKDNEEESAALAASALSSAGVTQATGDRVTRLIFATKTHQVCREDLDCQLLLDADLAILGTPPEEYDSYAQAIRREYEWVGEADYRAGRARVLRGFLERDRLYGTEALFAALEGPARANLQREITWLTPPTSEIT